MAQKIYEGQLCFLMKSYCSTGIVYAIVNLGRIYNILRMKENIQSSIQILIMIPRFFLK